MMPDNTNQKVNSPTGDQPGRVWVNILWVVGRWKSFIFLATVLTMAITAGLSLLIPKKFESKAVVLLPEKSGILLDALSSSTNSDLGSLGASILGGGTTGNLNRYLAIVGSRRLREEVIKRYDLLEEYDVDKMEDALDILDKAIVAESDRKMGTITIYFRYKEDPDKTAEMTNFIVSKLDEINRLLATEQARSTRKFIEFRYLQSKSDLRIAEDSLNLFQKKHGVISIPDQVRVGIEAAAELQAQTVATEIEYNVKKKTMGTSHPDLMRLESQLEELRKSQRQLDRGGLDMSVFIPFKNAPDLALEYFRLYREVQINQKIMEFVVPQYEQAKIQEARDTPTLLVLDSAKPADYAYWPRKKLLTIAAGLACVFLTTMLIYVRSFMWSSWMTEHREVLNTLRLFIKKTS